MKQNKKRLALALLLAAALALGPPAWASGGDVPTPAPGATATPTPEPSPSPTPYLPPPFAPTPTPRATLPPVEYRDSEDVTIKDGESLPDNVTTPGGATSFEGHIKPTLISAALPCEIPFHVVTGADGDVINDPLGDLTMSKIVNAENAYIINNSVVPIELSVIDVTVWNVSVNKEDLENARPILVPTVPKSVTLMSDARLVRYGGDALLALGAEGETFATADALNQKALTVEANVTGPVPVLPYVKAGDKVALNVFGLVASGSAIDFSFTVTTTLRISPAVRPVT